MRLSPFQTIETIGDAPINVPSPNLIDTLTALQRRQAWMRDYRIEVGMEKLAFVGAAKRTRSVSALAKSMRQELGIGSNWAESFRTWEDALKAIRHSIETAGILVFGNSVVGSK